MIAAKSNTETELHRQFADSMLKHNLWWSITLGEGVETIELSSSLQSLINKPVACIEDIMGKYATPLPRLKIEEADANLAFDEDTFLRFVASFETVQGKRSYQNQVQLIQKQPQRIYLINCVDVTEMVEFEREIVDTQGRLSVSQVYEKQEILENQNRIIKESYAKQSRFLGLLSHELRSPLLGITSLIKRLRSKFETQPEAEKMLKTVSMTAQQSTYLVNDILTYTQTEYDGLRLHPGTHSINEILENVKQLTKSLANDKGLNLSVVRLIKHDEIYVDAVRLTQVLINLIINAIKFTELGGVNVEIKELANYNYRFIVSDSGEGIPKASLKKIFEPFAQIEAEVSKGQTARRYLGAGLGLFVVYELVKAMGGKVDVSSREQVGTQFEFTLNLSGELNAGKAFKENSIEKGSLSPSEFSSEANTQFADENLDKTLSVENQLSANISVLIADDSEINRMVLAGYLEDLDCQVVEAEDGRKAWRSIQDSDFDYVMLDIQMPWLDGIEVAKKLKAIRQEGKQSKLKGVFAITAGGNSKDFSEAKDLIEQHIFDEWLVKPVNKIQIIKLFEDYQAEDEGSNNELSNQDEVDTIKLTKETMLNEAEEDTAIEQIPDAFKHLVAQFVEEMSGNVAKLYQLNKESDLQTIRELAHYMKGNAMLFQLEGLVKLLKELETTNTDDLVASMSAHERHEKTQNIISNVENIIIRLSN